MCGLPPFQYGDASDLCGDISDLYDKLAAAEHEIDSVAMGEDFLPFADLLRSDIHGTI